MKNFVVKILLAVAALTLPSLASAQSTGYSYIGAWQPPIIYQSNTWYSKTAAFSGPSNATITTIQWQLQWNLNNGSDGIPSGLEMKICDASSNCTTFTSPTVDGNTSYFTGESATQTSPSTSRFRQPTPSSTAPLTSECPLIAGSRKTTITKGKGSKGWLPSRAPPNGIPCGAG
jgi:hypothetical protein